MRTKDELFRAAQRVIASRRQKAVTEAETARRAAFAAHPELAQADDAQMRAGLTLARTAALGGEVSVPTMGTEARITIPEGTQTGKIFRLRGKGVPHLHGGGNGDLYVHAFVETPVNLTSKQKKMLKEFDESIKEGGTKHSPQSTSFLDKMKKFFS